MLLALLLIYVIGWYLYRAIPFGFDISVVFISGFIFSFVLLLRFWRGRFLYPGRFSSLLRADLLFIVFYGLVFLLPYAQAAGDFNVLSVSKFIDELFLDASNKAIVLAIALLCAFVVGSFYGDRLSFRIDGAFFKGVDFYLEAMKVSGFLLFLLMLYFDVSGGSASMMGDYTGLATGNRGTDGVYFLLTQLSMLVAAFGLVVLAEKRHIDLVFMLIHVLVLFWLLRLLASGDRNNFLLIAMTYIVGFSIYVRRINTFALILIFTAGWFMYQLVEYTRTTGARSIGDFFNAILSAKVQRESLGESSISLTTTTLRATIDISPLFEYLHYGWFKLVGFLGVIPFVRQFLPAPADGYYTSAQVLTDHMLGPAASWSLGSNVVSDLILDGGFFLGVVGMWTIGVFSTAFVRGTKGGAAFGTQAFYLIVASLLFQMPRYSFDFPVRNFVWFFYVLILTKIWLYINSWSKG